MNQDDSDIIKIRVEKHQIKPTHPSYKLIDSLCFKAKNLYNLGLYTERQIFFKRDPNIEKETRSISGIKLSQYLKNEEAYKDLPSYISQAILFKVAQTFNSFIRSNNDYYKHSEKYLGKPRLPKYKDKTKGRYIFVLPYTAFRYKRKDPQYISFNEILEGFQVKTHLDSSKHLLKEARFVPHGTHITLEIVYEMKDEPLDTKNLKYIAGIDIGVDNFSTISILKPDTNPLIINGKGLKSYNKYFNKKLAYLKSKVMTQNNKQYTTKRIQNLFKKRNNYMDNWIHHASKMTVNHLYKNQVKAVVIGKNKNWKQNSKLSSIVNQTFIQFPYDKYIKQLIYKCKDLGIEVYIAKEPYTSGTSYLDNEPPIKEFYNKKRRIHRGLFRSNEGIPINADVNAAFQITKKAYKTDYKDSYNLRLTPIRINVA